MIYYDIVIVKKNHIFYKDKRACCLKDKYSPGERRMYLKPKFDVTSL